MFALFVLAFLIGMQHALEADHVAAVSSMVTREKSWRGIIRSGTVWGVGHTVTLLVFAGTAAYLGVGIHESLAHWLEFGVGLMLIALGGHVLYRLWRDRIHFHMHEHDGGQTHFHAHSHAGEGDSHDQSGHRHRHPRLFPFRALAVGMMHGMAGSAALLLLTAATLKDPIQMLIYVALFGVGSIIGMAVLSGVIAVPLVLSGRFMTWANRGLQGVIGSATICVGLVTLWQTQLQSFFVG
ncbi:MAG: hypothetical protein ACPGO3_10080 [Magnetospiraceae bacterium]